MVWWAFLVHFGAYELAILGLTENEESIQESTNQRRKLHEVFIHNFGTGRNWITCEDKHGEIHFILCSSEWHRC